MKRGILNRRKNDIPISLAGCLSPEKGPLPDRSKAMEEVLHCSCLNYTWPLNNK